MTPRLVPRTMGIAIALAGIVDPVWTLTRPTPKPLTIAVLDERGFTVAAELERALSREYSVTIRGHMTTADAAACPAIGDCIVISGGQRPLHITAGATVAGAVRLNAETAQGVRIRRVTAPQVVHPGASATLDVELAGGPAAIQVFDGDILVGEEGRPEGRPFSSPEEGPAFRLASTIQWTPIADGLRELRVRAGNDEVHIGVDVAPMRARVLVYEPRPSWTGTFVRRALEADPRFDVRARAALGHALSVSTGDAVRLEPRALADASVVIVGAPELLSAAEVAMLDRFARVRGGSVVLLPDRLPAGPVLALVSSDMQERRESQPREIGPLKGSEYVVFDNVDLATTTLAAANDAPVIIGRSRGSGRIVISGALDAWRFRDQGDAFARFWTSVVADAADATGAPLSLAFDTMLARPGQWIGVTAERRAMESIVDAVADATLSCDGQAASPLRLWPDGAPGRFRGSFRASRPGACRVDATVGDRRASARFLVSDTARDPRPEEHELAGAVSAHGGIVVVEQQVEPLVTRLRASAAPDRISRQTRPMRSPWWIVPFAACLTGEWWLRRRKGLR